MKVRILSGLAAALVVVAILAAGSPAIIIGTALVAVISSFEFCKAMDSSGIHPFRAICIFSGLLLLPIGFLWEKGLIGWEHLMLISFVLLIIVSAYFLANYGKYNNSDFASTILSMAYIPGTLIFFIAILSLQNGMQLIYLVLAGTVAADTFAYFSGVLFGSHKIIPKVSPKKTWEGSIGGVIGSMIVVYTIGRLLNNSGHFFNYAVLGFLTGTVSQLGDWTASMFKRNSGIKDFGSIMPGHGGILDRCDSFLFTAPTVYFFALFFAF